MCSCVAFVMLLCQPWLCNSCIKEKLTLIVQLITPADGAGRTDGRVHTHTSKRDQLVPGFEILPMPCMSGRLLFEETFCTSPLCPCLLFALFCSSVSLHALYIASLHILCIISHAQHRLHTFLLSGISDSMPTPYNTSLCGHSKKPLCRRSGFHMATATRPGCLTRSD